MFPPVSAFTNRLKLIRLKKGEPPDSGSSFFNQPRSCACIKGFFFSLPPSALPPFSREALGNPSRKFGFSTRAVIQIRRIFSRILLLKTASHTRIQKSCRPKMGGRTFGFFQDKKENTLKACRKIRNSSTGAINLIITIYSFFRRNFLLPRPFDTSSIT